MTRVVSVEDLRRGYGLIPQTWTERERLVFFSDRADGATPGDTMFVEIVDAILAPVDRTDGRAVLAALLAAVQGWVTFTPDRRGADTWQSPRVTFLWRKGDCEDMAMLLAALVRVARVRMGLALAARLVWLRQPGRDLDHVSAQVAADDAIDETPVVISSDATGEGMGRWQWAETTVEAELGEDPYRALQRVRGARVEDVLGRVLGGDS